jgi:hypothetical protein
MKYSTNSLARPPASHDYRGRERDCLNPWSNLRFAGFTAAMACAGYPLALPTSGGCMASGSHADPSAMHAVMMWPATPAVPERVRAYLTVMGLEWTCPYL